MINNEMSKSEFFHEFTVKLCSSLDLRKAVYQCALFVKEIIPFEILSLAIITDKPYEMKQAVRVMSDGELLDEQVFTVSAEGWGYMMEQLQNNKILLMYEPENRVYTESLVGYAKKDILESYDISVPLVFEDKSLGFFAIRPKDKPTKEQVELISSVQEPIAHAVAAAIHFENKSQQENEPTTVDLIFSRIKLLCDIDTDKKLAQELDTIPTNIANCRLRNSIPYDKIIQFCQRERVSMDFIFMNNPFILNKKTKNGLYKAVLSSGPEYISAAEVENLLELPQGSLDTYRKSCALNYRVIPPVDKLSVDALQLFQNALLEQHGKHIPDKTCDTIDIPVATGVVLEDKQIETTEKYLYFCKQSLEDLKLSSDVFAYYIENDSMEPTLIKKDIVIIDPNFKDPRSSGLYAVSIAGNIAVRRLSPTDSGKVTMICDNKIYPVDTISSENVIGRIIWHARNI